jgi:hypothetical protein
MEPHIGRIARLGTGPAPQEKGRGPAKQRRFADMFGDRNPDLQQILRLAIDGELTVEIGFAKAVSYCR